MDKNEHDMTLFDFLLLCWRAFKGLMVNIVNWFLKTVRLGLQYFWVVLIGVAFGFGCAWILSREPLRLYEGNATVYVTEGMKEAVKNGVQLFFASGDTTRFRHYGIPRESVYAVRYMDFHDIVDAKCDSIVDFVDVNGSVSVRDTSVCILPDRFGITIKLRGIGDFYPFMNAFKGYLRDMPLVAEADADAKRLVQSRLDYLNKEVARLDSFATYDYFTRPHYYRTQGWGTHTVITEREQELYHEQLRRVVRERDYVQQQVDRTPDILNFETPFVVGTTPPMLFYKYGVVLGGVFGLLLALLVKYRKTVWNYLRSKE